MRWSSYVALGDSFTEGMDDALPSGVFRGWADLVANRLAAEATLSYANLAIRGKKFDAVVEEQVPATLRMAPDLVSFAAGGNDVLRRKVDVPALVARFDEIVRMLRASGADVVLFQFADITPRMPGKSLVKARTEAMNIKVAETAERHGAYLIDLYNDQAFHDPRLWSIDRLHLNAAGHRRVAAKVLTALGVPAEPSWSADLPPAEPAPWLARRRADAQWARNHLVPWVGRRLTGRSSGDGLTAKRPELTKLILDEF
ncbi:SGNH/GDSL hydrolase family protein [Longispora albida]|uniref:SGNH/GDSL hydrolase family protein n=1 Tax=Longispora albida TaxID=203523 RepID=UPI0003658BA9|nr:SGNH/GDSL hydrolase family protein [Longispora albida]